MIYEMPSLGSILFIISCGVSKLSFVYSELLESLALLLRTEFPDFGHKALEGYASAKNR